MKSTLIVMAGLPGTGKSSLARRFRKRLTAVLLDKDTLRAAMFSDDLIEYSTRQDDFVLSVMLEIAEYLFGYHQVDYLILDGRPFAHAYQLEQVEQFARLNQLNLRVLLCTCSDETARRRLEGAQRRGKHLAANRDFNLYLKMKTSFEPIELPHLVLNTDQHLGACTRIGLEYIREEDQTESENI